ncbi:hypothetical protein HMPREF1631_05755 [Arcanobacterium sp. S3PF19]|nr:hypothetical protein HMPREF1631_05755 [Arcanobacterium sp. S3PF19]
MSTLFLPQMFSLRIFYSLFLSLFSGFSYLGLWDNRLCFRRFCARCGASVSKYTFTTYVNV